MMSELKVLQTTMGKNATCFPKLLISVKKEKRLLILTTNLTPKEINERYGLRTLDRLKAIVRAIKFHGDSLRDWPKEETI